MLKRALAAVLMAGGLTACSAGRTEVAAPGPVRRGLDIPVVAEPDVSAMLVIQASGPFAVGDTIRVDLANIAEERWVAYYERSQRAGRISLENLGPAGVGAMVVTARTLNVRSCPSARCQVVARLSRAQEVSVDAFRPGWYRVRSDGRPIGFASADYLRLPVVYPRTVLDHIEGATRSYYSGELSHLTLDGYGALFEGYRVDFNGELLSLNFYTRFSEGEPVLAVCNAMRGIARFVQSMMAQVPGSIFAAYSAGVYLHSADSQAREQVMVAGLAAGGSVYCAESR
ncbi:MAG: SH3 domain-containing protein [Gemmatimonadota bacterium]|nr:MAG: SH3 domain-containing protein [Gemmatimonadota bacterium]